MDHVRVNLTNFLVIGFSSFIFLFGALYTMTWAANRSVPVISPASKIFLNVFNLIPAA